MFRVVIDTNILFSAILNTNSKFAQILLTDNIECQIFAPNYIQEEIFNHQNKILTLKEITSDEMNQIYNLLINNIKFIPNNDIPSEFLDFAIDICLDIDIDDAYFVATSLYCFQALDR